MTRPAVAEGSAEILDFPSGDVVCIARELPLIEPGRYLLSFIRYETCRQFKGSKVTLWFKVVSPGPEFGAEVARHYNATWVAGAGRRKGGRFKFGPCSAFFREYCAVFLRPVRRDRVSMDRFRNAVILGEIGTVTSGHDQTEIPEAARYSVVRRLIALEAGGG